MKNHSANGKVTFDGKPVAYGTVNLLPDRSKGNKGPFGVAEIKDGVYQTNPDFGISVGPLLATFTIYDALPPNNTMLANIQNVALDVPQGTTEWDFNLTPSDVKEFRP